MKSSGTCSCCGTYREHHIHRDHIVPKTLGGSDAPENIQLLCANCHEDKTFSEMKIIKNRPGAREQHSLTHMGLHHSPETRRKMSEAQKGKVMSQAARAKMSIAAKGRKFAPETRAKLSAALKGRKIRLGHPNKKKEKSTC